jgi:hypothetical protein
MKHLRPKQVGNKTEKRTILVENLPEEAGRAGLPSTMLPPFLLLPVDLVDPWGLTSSSEIGSRKIARQKNSSLPEGRLLRVVAKVVMAGRSLFWPWAGNGG